MDDRNAESCSTDTTSRLTTGEILSEWVRENYDPMPTRNWTSGSHVIDSIAFIAHDKDPDGSFIKFTIRDYDVTVYSGFHRKQGSKVGPIDIRDPNSLTQISDAVKRELNRRGTNVS